jgi:hypothetical protein
VYLATSAGEAGADERPGKVIFGFNKIPT